MSDPYVTRELTVRDLLVHRSGLGLGAGDLLWWPESTYDRKEIARRLRFIPPATSFRSAYAYDNVLYLVAGELIEAVSGQTWEDFVATRILAKVGMTRQQRAAFRGDRRRQRRDAARASRRAGAADPSVRERQHQPRRRHQLLGRATWRSGCASSCPAASWPTARACSPPTTARQLTTMVTPIPIGDPPPELAPLQGQLQRLRARLRRARLSRPQGAAPHRRAARLRLARDHDSRPEPGRRGADEPGIGRRLRRDRVPHPRPLPRRAGVRLDRRLPHGRRRAASRGRHRRRGRRRRA